MKRTSKRALALLLALVMVLGMLPVSAMATDTAWAPTTTQAALVVTGDSIVTTPANVANEVAYTLEELKAIETTSLYYSALNSSSAKSIYYGEGVTLDNLLANTGVDLTDAVSVASGTFARDIDYTDTVYYYPNIFTDSEDDAAAVEPMIAWAATVAEDAASIPAQGATATDLGYLQILLGQSEITEQNNKYYTSDVDRVIVGDALETALTIGEDTYTRADIMLEPYYIGEYTYSTSGGDDTVFAKGVPLVNLLSGYDDDYEVEFVSADGYANDIITIADIKDADNEYIIAYENGSTEATLTGIYKSDSETVYGYLTVYKQGSSPSSMVNEIIISEPTATETNAYKHITAGDSYNIDAITGATITVEGPGVTATTPMRVGDIEDTDDSNIYRGTYTDATDGARIYEGVDVLAIIDGLVNSNVEKLDDGVSITFKNRWRQDIVSITYEDIKAASEADSPVILAYGVSDGTDTAPFVFDSGDAGYISSLDNDDGCIKLVYDSSELSGVSTPDAFASVAYLYVEAGAEAPGFKHTEATDDAYKNVANTEFLITFTGSAIGREVNYTVEELEAMVTYDENGDPEADGLGFKAEYNLSNTTYWYVNEYEGVKLWDLLTTKLGVDSADYDDDTLVSFASWDNYQTSAAFTFSQLANPDLFYYYEKSPLDVGTDRPSKDDLAEVEYQPDNLIGDGWTTDSNGYPVKEGYPVMLAYGVNGYPYVLDSSLEGYYGGLGNDGGPLKVIFGKTDNMYGTNSSSDESYAYFYNNGSNQLQRAQEIYVGDDVRYSTHLENPSYTSMADDEALTVEIVTETGSTETYTFTLGEIESILYDEDVSKSDMDLQGRQQKGYYTVSSYDDLYEGVDLWYLLSEEIGMAGLLGTVDFYADDETSSELSITLDDVQVEGANSNTGVSGLGSMVAFAKNGYPLVAESSSEGYLSSDDVTGKTIKNQGGPLMFVATDNSVSNLTKIVVNLEADKYAHTGDYESYASDTVEFTGAVTNESVSLTVGDIEKLQKYMVTGEYDGTTYRGVLLSSLLSDSAVGASALKDVITISNAAGDSIDISISALDSVILAYGSGETGSETPLTTDGPIMLVTPEGNTIKNVTTINVSAAELSGWTHSAGSYLDYADNTFVVSGSNVSASKTFTVESLEALSADYKIFDSYKMGNDYYFEGIDLLKLIENSVGYADGVTESNITIYSSDGYATAFTATQLKEGVNGQPILLAYGQGTSATTGLPLVESTSSSGYDSTIDNAYGPLRLVVNDNTGWCAKYAVGVVVGSGALEDPEVEEVTGDFIITGDIKEDIGYTIKDLKTYKQTEAQTYNYYKDGAQTDTVTGALLTDVLEANGITSSRYSVSITTTDGWQHSSYKEISLTDIEDDAYFIAWDIGEDAVADTDDDGVEATVRIYRNYNDGLTDDDSWYNRITNVSGVEIIDAISGETVFTVSEEGTAVKTLDIDDLYSLSETTGTYTVKNTEYSVTGVMLDDLLSSAGITDSATKVNIKTVDDYQDSSKSVGYWDITLAEISEQGYILGYEVDGETVCDDIEDDSDNVIGNTYIRLYRNYDDGSTWNNRITLIDEVDTEPLYNFTVYRGTGAEGDLPVSSIRSIEVDSTGGMWVGTLTGGAHYFPAGETTSTIDTTTTDTYTLESGAIQSIAIDDEGGIWFAQGTSYVDATQNKGAAYRAVDGTVTYYNTDTEGTIPNNYVQDIKIDDDGNVWFASFGGLTKFDGTTWTTWDMSDCTSNGAGYSVVTFDFDGNGGVWAGLYPNTIGTTSTTYGDMATYEGGYVHVSSTGATTFYEALNADGSAITENYRLADFWVRDVAVDADGGVYIIRSGATGSSYEYLAEKGGLVDYVAPNGTVTRYTGADIIGDYLSTATVQPTGATQIVSEIRTIEIDSSGNIWLGTTQDGAFKLSSDLEVLAQVVSTEGDWPSIDGYDDIYALEVVDGTIYLGSNKGVMTAKTSSIIEDLKDKSEQSGSAGTTTAPSVSDDYDLLVTGDEVSEKSFTIDDLEELGIYTGTYSALNSYGTRSEDEYTGVRISDILDAAGLKDTAQSVKLIASDGYYRQFNLDSEAMGIYSEDKDGNPIILDLDNMQVIIGQTNETHVNKSSWVSDIVQILVGDETVVSGSGSSGVYTGTSTSTTEVEAEADGSVTADITDIEGGAVSFVGTDDNPSVTLDEAVVAGLAELGSELTGSFTTTDIESITEGLTDEQKAQATEVAADRPVLVVEIAVDGEAVTSLGGDITVSVAYEKTEQEDANALVVYKVEDDGTLTLIPRAMYDEETGEIIFATDETGVFIIGENEQSFSDADEHWASPYIEFLASRNIINGVGDGNFAPDNIITRAEFTKILAGVSGTDLGADTASSFNDVDGYFAPYITWASELGIVNGTGNGNFDPDAAISRDTMAVMVSRYLTTTSSSLDKVNDAVTFSDDDDIEAIYSDAIAELYEAGIISGVETDDGVQYNPKDELTRGEACKVLVSVLEGLLK